MLGWVAFDVLFTAGVARLGRHWITGFDIRGPFLLMSPVYAATLAFAICADRFSQYEIPEGKPKPRDVDLIETVALEFELGPVSVIQKRQRGDLRLALDLGGGEVLGLPENWSKMDVDARRFAVVWTLQGKQSLRSKLKQRVPRYALRAVAMIAAGFNLWLIIADHVPVALWVAYTTVYGRARALALADARALSVMRDLKAAISFARSDTTNDSSGMTVDERIASLRKAAGRMGIA